MMDTNYWFYNILMNEQKRSLVQNQPIGPHPDVAMPRTAQEIVNNAIETQQPAPPYVATVSAFNPGVRGKIHDAVMNYLIEKGFDNYRANEFTNKLVGNKDKIGLIDVTPAWPLLAAASGGESLGKGIKDDDAVEIVLGVVEALIAIMAPMPFVTKGAIVKEATRGR
jgi:hypothetical protein